MSTISDVARAAGVSVATVSRALRGVSTVNPATRERVLRAATELDYVASPTAASLASGRTRVIGIVTPFLTRWFFATAISAIEKTLREYGFHALLVDLEADSALRRRELTNQMLSKRADGFITINVPLREDELALLDKLGLPVVAIGNPVAGYPLIHIDDQATVRTAVDHLVDLGHSHIGYVGAVPAEAEHRLVPWSRLTGFRAVMADHGLRVHEEWVIPCDWSAQDAARQAAALFLHDPAPTAVVAGSDEMAIGVMAAATESGHRVPEDLSVIGIDDFVLADVLRLTTVRQDVVAQGRAAATTLLHQLLSGSAEPSPALPAGMTSDGRLTLDTTLVKRRTTSRLRGTVSSHPPLLGTPADRP
ncbi:LacI family DNA-binding transcriptional regulator [Ornithinimicrobium sediminis]|uniref:LacI family DNA-binding transcriptional regulator n=1 Tax=Ornithinimicrobium sediminis TaxID=2904603 RepID=UPI001E3680FE|nr:LacI family DNA-binding transcriptional regulator [Ornithinimicrobium sediminis]MCE0487986.1 LacI family transcriptional regulator [Ornithinimicrobium sediminis]